MPHAQRCLLLAAIFSTFAHAEEPLTVAVASNFLSTAQEISAAFTKSTGVEVRLSSGSTGKLYAQIVHGAPYDVFLAADVERPLLLEENGFIIPESRQSYALGSLVLWSSDAALLDKDCRAVLEDGAYKRLAIANPDTAPYGLAAKEFLEAAGLWNGAKDRLVFGENISQAFQFVASGNATLGLVAASQLVEEIPFETACYWPVSSRYARPITQDGVILRGAGDRVAARRFMAFFGEQRVSGILERRGYTVPVHDGPGGE